MKFEKQLYKLINEKYLGEEGHEEDKMTSEDKKSFDAQEINNEIRKTTNETYP